MTPKPLNKIQDFCLKLFDLIGAEQNVASACVSSVMHGTRFGVDSHGVRLIPHYINVLETGRLNKNPSIKFKKLKFLCPSARFKNYFNLTYCFYD